MPGILKMYGRLDSFDFKNKYGIIKIIKHEIIFKIIQKYKYELNHSLIKNIGWRGRLS